MQVTTQNLIVLADRMATKAWSPKPAAYLTEEEAESLTGGAGLDQALRWMGAEGCLVYPAFQFALGTVHPDVTRAKAAFIEVFAEAGYRAPLALLAAWLAADFEVCDGMTALEAIREGKGSEVTGLLSAWASGLLEQSPSDSQVS